VLAACAAAFVIAAPALKLLSLTALIRRR
jgi:hypothetical protein